MLIYKKILFTGSNGRFGKVFKKTHVGKEYDYPTSKDLDITDIKSVERYFKKNKTDLIIHCAALSRPMTIHDENIQKSIDMNIIGTSNIVKICSEFNIKLIYFSTGYVYPGIEGNYKETDALLPINNYAWSKMGGECAVSMYKNSLILRITMCEKPFLHKKAFYDIETNFIYHDDVIKIIPKILDKTGVINVGGKTQSVYTFAKKSNKDIKKISGKKLFPPKPSMNVKKINKLMKW